MSAYYESAEGVEIGLTRVWRELDKHGIIGADRLFIVAMLTPNKRGLYDAQELLRWIGY